MAKAGSGSRACPAVRFDGDGFVATVVGGSDCDDAVETVSPVARDRCGDGIDQDCDGADLPRGEDVDGDGFGALAVGGDDCDDGRAGAGQNVVPAQGGRSGAVTGNALRQRTAGG